MNALNSLQQQLTRSAHYTTTEDREKNIDKTKGLIQKYFVDKEPPVLRHGPGLALDFENSLRRSRIETPRYEFKQGILRLAHSRPLDEDLLQRIVKHICGISNVGPDADGYIFIGVADDQDDANRIAEIDRITPIDVGGRYVVGIDRESIQLNISLERYLENLLHVIRESELSAPLKQQILTQIDVVSYKDFSVIRITVPAQDKVSFVGDKAFTREGPSTIEAKGPVLLAINDLFQKRKRG